MKLIALSISVFFLVVANLGVAQDSHTISNPKIRPRVEENLVKVQVRVKAIAPAIDRSTNEKVPGWYDIIVTDPEGKEEKISTSTLNALNLTNRKLKYDPEKPSTLVGKTFESDGFSGPFPSEFRLARDFTKVFVEAPKVTPCNELYVEAAKALARDRLPELGQGESENNLAACFGELLADEAKFDVFAKKVNELAPKSERWIQIVPPFSSIGGQKVQLLRYNWETQKHEVVFEFTMTASVTPFIVESPGTRIRGLR